MENPSARLLRLLSLLQTRPRWTGAQLCDRLDVSARTLRYDISKLRDLGYGVDADTGVGVATPCGREGRSPLQLDDDEAVAMALGLRVAAGVAGVWEPAATALTKLEQVLPWRLRGRVDALRSFTDSVGEPGVPATDPEVVVLLTGACRDQRRVGFDYTGRDGSRTRRDVEPYRLIQMDRRWHLLAFDPDRDDWRSFRLDRMSSVPVTGARFTAREAPEPTSLLASTDAFYQRHRATVLVQAPVEIVTQRLPRAVPVERVDEACCRVHATGETAFVVAVNLLMLDQDFTVEATSPEVLDALRLLADRIAAATSVPAG